MMDTGESAQCDFWFPGIGVPVGCGQTRTAKQLPVLRMVTGSTPPRSPPRRHPSRPSWSGWAASPLVVIARLSTARETDPRAVVSSRVDSSEH